MYAGVPTVIPIEVSAPESCSALLTPKSATTACDELSRMFSGFMSRWITPCACAKASASSVSRRMRTLSLTFIGPSRVIRARSDSPARKGIT